MNEQELNIVVEHYENDELAAANEALADAYFSFREEHERVVAENAKMRELVRDYDKCLDTALYLAGDAGYPCMPDSGLFSSLHPRMRELGIEVK